MPASTPLLLGHRGARNYAPENTMAAFELALRHGCDGFELDVRLSADRCAVICHDPTFNGMAIESCTFEQLAGADGDDMATALLGARGAPPAIESLPLLDDVLETFSRRAWIDIELKVPLLEPATIDLVRQWQPARGVLVSSFLPDVITACAALDTEIPLGLICNRREALALWESLPVSYVLPHRKLLDRPLLEELQVAGKRVIAWTVNEEREMKQLADWGIDGLISADTERLGRAFDRLG